MKNHAIDNKKGSFKKKVRNHIINHAIDHGKNKFKDSVVDSV